MDGEQQSQPSEGGRQQGQRGQEQLEEGGAGRGRGRELGYSGFWETLDQPSFSIPSRSSSVPPLVGGSGRYEEGREVYVDIYLKCVWGDCRWRE